MARTRSAKAAGPTGHSRTDPSIEVVDEALSVRVELRIVRYVTVAQADDADIHVARADIVDAGVDQRVLAGSVTLLDNALAAQDLLDGITLIQQVFERRR